MAIRVEHEPKEVEAQFPNIMENCFFCRKPTRYWHKNTNNPVCPDCGKKHKVGELPDYGATIRRNKYKKEKSNG